MEAVNISTGVSRFEQLRQGREVLRVAALSGGYDRDEATERLARNHGMIASFPRALTLGLSAQQRDEAFNAMLDASIQSIFDASST